MPAQNRVGGDDRGDLPQPTTAQPVSVHGQSATLLIGQRSRRPRSLRAEDAVLFDQICDGLLLRSAHQPATATRKIRRAVISTSAGVYTTDSMSVPDSSADKWGTTRSKCRICVGDDEDPLAASGIRAPGRSVRASRRMLRSTVLRTTVAHLLVSGCRDSAAFPLFSSDRLNRPRRGATRHSA
jgi:hypothetical protein